MLEHILAYLKSNTGILIPAVVGSFITLVTTEMASKAVMLSRVLSGVFCAIFLTDPLIDWLGLESETYRSAISGLLAINGFQIVSFFSSLSAEKILGLIKEFKKK